MTPKLPLLLVGLLLVVLQRPSQAEHPVVPGYERFSSELPEDQLGHILLAELNCVACHAAPRETVSLLNPKPAPELSEVGSRVQYDWLKAFIKDPHGTKPGTTMPNLLAKLPEDERAKSAEALAQFLSTLSGRFRRPEGGRPSAIRGKNLYRGAGCAACHTPNPMLGKENLKIATSVPLGDLAAKYTTRSLARFLREPLDVRHGGRMPGMNLSPNEALSIAFYLTGGQPRMPDNPASTELGLRYRVYYRDVDNLPDLSRMEPADEGVSDAFNLGLREQDDQFIFEWTGYIDVPQDGNYTFSVTSDDGSRLWVGEYLIADNDGVHGVEEESGSIDLSKGKHFLRVAYFEKAGGETFEVRWSGPGFADAAIPEALLSHGPELEPADDLPQPNQRERIDRNPETIAKGRTLFSSIGCASCHETGLELTSDIEAAPLADLDRNLDAGCLTADAEHNNAFLQLSGKQISAISAALKEGPPTHLATAEGRIRHTMTQMNCYACHTRDGVGGVEPERRAFFRSNGDVDLGEEGEVPPHLDLAGFKLRQRYLEALFDEGSSARPYLATRMPVFGLQNVDRLPEDLWTADGEGAYTPPPEPEDDLARSGWHLVGVRGLACVSCHGYADYPSLGVPAVNLAQVADRVRPEWFKQYLLDPQKFKPGTRMPPFWTNGEAMRKDILDGDTDKQIEAIWQYLSSEDNGRVPQGLVKAGILLAPKSDEAIIYRNFIRDAGPRAISVGYPEGANIAFDANAGRIALLWQGAFIDAEQHWTSRGSGFQEPLGFDVRPLPEGPGFAVLASSDDRWPDLGRRNPRPDNYAFLGFRLDERRRPQFIYEVEGVRIMDFPKAIADGPSVVIERDLQIEGRVPPGFHMMLADGDIRKIDAYHLMVDDELLIEIVSRDGTGLPVLRERFRSSQEALLPIDAGAPRANVKIRYIWP